VTIVSSVAGNTKVAKGDLVVNVRDYGAVGNGVTNDTTAIQAALSASKHVLIPPGMNCLVSTITLTQSDQILTCAGGSKITGNGTAVPVVQVSGDFASLRDVYVVGAGSNTAGIVTSGFRNYLHNCTVTGVSTDALYVNGLETSVIMGKYKGGTVAGVHLLKQDCYLANVYVEGNRDGLYTSGIGSVTAHHVHSFGNTRHGFYLYGASYAQLVGCYADTNGANGYEIGDTVNGLTLLDCWGYKSAAVTAGENDFAVYNARNVKIIGCRSSGAGAAGKGASFKFDTQAQADLIGCYGEVGPTGHSSAIGFTNCGGALQRYNRPTDTGTHAGVTIAAAGSTSASINLVMATLSTTPGIQMFEATAMIRRRPVRHQHQPG
jgi:hypothetical protein